MLCSLDILSRFVDPVKNVAVTDGARTIPRGCKENGKWISTNMIDIQNLRVLHGVASLLCSVNSFCMESMGK